MIRSYAVLGSAGGLLLLLAAFATGFAAGGEGAGRATHRAVSAAATAAALGLHWALFAHLAATLRRAREVVRQRGLPDWMEARAARNPGRASRFVLGGAASVVAAAWLGLAAAGEATGGALRAWHAAAAGFAAGFNAVALLIEALGAAAGRRLLAELEAQEGPARPATTEAAA